MRSLSRFSSFAVVVLIGLFGFCQMALADQVPAATNTPPPVGSTGNQQKVEIVIKDVKVDDPKDPKMPLEFAVGKTLIVTFAEDNLKNLKNDKGESISVSKLSLFLDDQLMKGLVPVTSTLTSEKDSLRFDLESTNDNREAWTKLFKNKASGTKDGDKVAVAVGIENGTVWRWGGNELTLEYFPDYWAYFLLFLAIAILFVTVLFGWKTSMLRDSGAPRSDRNLGTFSMARVQMALWFVTIVFAFLFIYAVTGNAPTITPGVLTLMGIGAGTALGAAAIDENKKGATPDMAKLTADKQACQQGVDDLQKKLDAAPPADPNRAVLQQQLQAATHSLNDANANLASPSNPVVAASEGFFQDILTDVNGISFHRLQVLGWMVVFWAMFVSSLFTRMTMTEFDSTQLALMGISGSTYLGFKFTEKQS